MTRSGLAVPPSRHATDQIYARPNRQRAYLLAVLTSIALLRPQSYAQMPAADSYFEFGTVVAINQRSIDIQTMDRERQRLVQHSFALSRETRADIVHIGDSVEVVFTATGDEWQLRRMIVLANGVPQAGAPARRTTSAPSTTPASAASSITPPPVDSVKLGAAPTTDLKKHGRTKAAVPTLATTVPPSAPPSSAPPQPPSLGVVREARPTSITPVTLGSPAEDKKRAAASRTNSVSIDHPAEECNRSSADWPSQPLRIAVLDFRYPTEREEAHDIGTTGGGSGTAVADLVFARLEEDEQNDDRFLFSRADRRRLDRSDFAGAARLGRQLGVDAVLAGTFIPIAGPVDANGFETGPKTFELRAGLVDTCTGQLLLQTSSETCKGAVSPGITAGVDPQSCTRFVVSAAGTANPKAYPHDFAPSLDAMLYPLEHSRTGNSGTPPAGTVTRVSTENVTVRLATHSQLRQGDQLILRASRLAKNPSTYTLHNLQNEEIGRVSIQTIQGDLATGSYAGDFVPRPGDIAEVSK